ncbi:shikimate kinase [Salipiger pallidus]|uniref:shikimate kinase n=1 Tax=Salipiger pallidus TaxID=1775170 RepID=UPI001668DF5B|nr:shikimate kinase [Salipiger pallidus]
MDGRDTRVQDNSVQALKLKKTVVLVGMMGAGKTAVGKALAQALNVPFRDSDAEIEIAAARSIAEIFERDGEAFFRRKEAQVISRLLDGTPSVLSTGGGAYMQEANRTAITDRGVAVWLDAPLNVLWNRVRHKDTRPLLRTDNPKETLREIYEARVPVYALADIAVPSEQGKTVEGMAQRVIEALKARDDVLKEG